jgi:hypothetical protein
VEDNKLDRIEFKVDKISEHVQEINVTLASQHESIKYHIKRTDLLEEQIKPLNAFKARFEGALKLLGVIGIIATIIEAIHMVFK